MSTVDHRRVLHSATSSTTKANDLSSSTHHNVIRSHRDMRSSSPSESEYSDSDTDSDSDGARDASTDSDSPEHLTEPVGTTNRRTDWRSSMDGTNNSRIHRLTADLPVAVDPISARFAMRTTNDTTTRTTSQSSAAPSKKESVATISSVIPSSAFTLIPATIEPVRSVPLISYYTSSNSASYTPIPSHPLTGRSVSRFSQEVAFGDMTRMECITFQNFYVSHLTIKQMVVRSIDGDRDGRSKQVWTTILHRMPLMTQPHGEGEAQKQWTITSQQFNSNYAPSRLHRLRFDYYQSSPNWRNFHLIDIQCWRANLSTPSSQMDDVDDISTRSPNSLRSTVPSAIDRSSSSHSGSSRVAQIESFLDTFSPSQTPLSGRFQSIEFTQHFMEISKLLEQD